MSNPTKEQQTAIDLRGKNIIVSAGAGSGKTFVLKERVLREITNETTIDKLVILTFTNNAAKEMKDRIRKIINEHPEVKDQADLLESAYITTFDSYAQSLVKKYNYLLNISKDFSIIDANIVNLELNKILDNILLRYYSDPDDKFNELITKYCYKNDTELKKSLISMYRSLLNIINYRDYLDIYLETFYGEDKINKFISEHDNNIKNLIDSLVPLYDELMNITLSESALEKNKIKYEYLLNIKNKKDLNEFFSLSIGRNTANTYTDKFTNLKEHIDNIEDELKELIKYDNETLKDQYLSTKTSVKVIINILKELDDKIKEFKDNHNSYEFADIAFKAIELVKNNDNVREEIKNSIHEIMIDEYQDTNDIQEEFISYIQNNNVYMVGDIKQSIYRFRNANPYIFKEKYDNYKDGVEGYRLDLTQNFRSRDKVIDNINEIFSSIMFDTVGGANYKEDHIMKFGNKNYLSNLFKDYDYNMKIYNYEVPKFFNFDRDEIEAFIIAHDIKKKLDSKIKVLDADNNYNEVTYSDFCILVDKSKNFELLKKVLEYYSIPATIYKDITISDDDEVYILKNLITLLTHIKDEVLDEAFKHAYMSIARSYIYKLSDNVIFDIFNSNSFKETPLYKKLNIIVKQIDSLSNQEIIIKLIEEFDMFNKLKLVGDINIRSSKLEYIINQANSLNKFGLDIYSLDTYFEEISKSNGELKMGGKNDDGDSVKIMTIHGSKGLEYPFIYMPYLYSEFTNRKKDRFNLDKNYGIMIPYNDGAYENTFVINLYNKHEHIENISEKIRLLYVAITRAREQFILINNISDKDETFNRITQEEILRSKSYHSLLNLLKEKFCSLNENINLESLSLTKDYNLENNKNYMNLIDAVDTTFKTKKLVINNQVLDNKHFSKQLSKIINKDFKARLDYGTKMHYIFEVYDFKNDNLNNLEITEEEKKQVRLFLNHEEVKNIKEAKIYKEHEILFNLDNNTYHGFIDLLLEYPDHFDIIDYKLSNIDSIEYNKQLNGYRKYIESKYHKTVNMYLYSIKKNIFKSIERDD